MKKRLFLLGATGFIGRRVLSQATAAGWLVRALVRSAEAARELSALGAEVAVGAVEDPASWRGLLAGSDVAIDLVQPALPARLGTGVMRRIARKRVAFTQVLLDELRALPERERPLLASVSGLDDLLPDASGRVDDGAPLRARAVGFARIGLPVRALVAAAGVDAVYLHLGTVYGPGKSFAEKILPGLAAGKLPVIGDGQNRTPLVHVEDAARALVHVVSQPRAAIVGRTIVVADGTATTQNQLFGETATLLGARAPRHVPRWLAALLVGRVLVETMSRDVWAEPLWLRASGFRFQHQDFRAGMAETVRSLDLLRPARDGKSPHPVGA